MTVNDCFQILELKPGATVEEVKAARNELLQVWHPDKYVSNIKLSEKAKIKTQKINEAFNILVNYLKTPGKKAQNSQTTRINVSETEENAVDEAYRKELKRVVKNREAQIDYQERWKDRRNRAKRQLNFTFLSAFFAGLVGLFIGLKELTLFLVLFVLAVGIFISFLTNRKPIKKSDSRH